MAVVGARHQLAVNAANGHMVDGTHMTWGNSLLMHTRRDRPTSITSLFCLHWYQAITSVPRHTYAGNIRVVMLRGSNHIRQGTYFLAGLVLRSLLAGFMVCYPNRD